VRRRLVRAERRGYTLVELIVMVSILALFVLLAQVNLFGALKRRQFEAQVQEFISAFGMAARAASERSRRYEIIVDIPEQAFVLREISSSNLADVLDEEIIAHGYFGENCHVAYVEFDDGSYTNDSAAKFRAGHAGWQYGGKVVFLDSSENPYAVVVNRLTTNVELVAGDPLLMTPKAKDEVPFL
jgi:type II secretory pathway pseudopilin PulG